MLHPLCPVCGLPLDEHWRCAAGHCFDVARQGYINLLTVDKKHSLHPGDTAEMVAARRRFLDLGLYRPISDALCACLADYAPTARTLLDAGCGEGYYLSRLTGIDERWGIDISKDATRYAAARDKGSRYLTASAAHLPFSDASFDALICLFALNAEEEFARVLKPGGVFIQAITGQSHLRALRRVIYPELREKEKDTPPELPHFVRLDTRRVAFDFSLHSTQAITDLLTMTPHVWRISKAGAEAARALNALDDHAEVLLHIFRTV